MSELEKIAKKVLSCEDLKKEECEYLFLLNDRNLDDLLYWANKIRKKFKGNSIKLCSIINAKSGMCSEDCGFCAQSAHNNCDIDIYPLVDKSKIEEVFKKSLHNKACCFGVVTSGRGITNEELKDVGEAIRLISKNGGVKVSASLGEISLEGLLYLKSFGLKKYHHNLETAESFFANVCTTHSFKDRISTVELVKKVGLELCCGGVFGLGEGWQHRLEFAMSLREISPDSVPLNFFNPIKGTRLQNSKPLSPQEILKIIAIFRFTLPKKDINVCGGKEVNLRDLQSWIFYAGANGTMTGGYLTTSGRDPVIDKKMIEDLGLSIHRIS